MTMTLPTVAQSLRRFVRTAARQFAADCQAWFREALHVSAAPEAPARPGLPVPKQLYFVMEERSDYAHLRTYTVYYSRLPDSEHRFLVHVMENDSREVVYFSSAPRLAPLERALESFLNSLGLVLLPAPIDDGCPEQPWPRFPHSS